MPGKSDKYIWRASYLPALNVDSQFTQDPGQDFDNLRFGLAEWKKVSRYLLEDFYVHTPWHDHTYTEGFTAYSYVDPKTNEGVLFSFRMENCTDDTLTVTLPYAKGTWVLTDADTGESYTVKDGKVTLHFAKPRTARLLWGKKK